LDALRAWFRRSGRAYRTWPQRLVIAVNCGMVVTCLVLASGLRFVYAEASEVDRVEIGEGLVLPEKTGEDEPMNFLMVGVDNGEGLEEGDPALNGREGELRNLNSDTIMVLRVDPATEQAAILSFPRDLQVKIPGAGTRKINAALSLGKGNPQLLIQTIWENFQIPVHHYLQVDLRGFQSLVDELGGVPVYFPTAVRDQKTGLFVELAGCTNLEGEQALAYVRSRNYQYNIDGKWKLDYSSDLGRISRQQDFIRRSLKKAVASGWRDPSQLKNVVDIAQDNVVLDEYLTPGDMLDLAEAFRAFNPETLDLYSLPVDEGFAGEASVVRLRTAEAQPTLEIFRGAAPVDGTSLVDVKPTVQVWNGTGNPGEATEVDADVRAAGLSTTRSPLDSQEGFGFETTTVRYGPGQEQAGLALARRLPGDPVIELDESLDDGYVLLITGADYAGVLSEPRPVEDFQDFLDDLQAAAEAAAEGATETTLTPGEDSSTTTTLIGVVPPEAPPDEECG
jgi:polyisoprenyl-teichoic acid--peptidoglycan teichoic acid transferase